MTVERVAAADVVVAMKARPGPAPDQGRPLRDLDAARPAGWDAEGIRPLPDEIDRRVQTLIAELSPDAAAAPLLATQQDTVTERVP